MGRQPVAMLFLAASAILAMCCSLLADDDFGFVSERNTAGSRPATPGNEDFDSPEEFDRPWESGKSIPAKTVEEAKSAATGTQPKHENAHELFQQWQENARINGNIPGGLLRSLATAAAHFVKLNPTDEDRVEKQDAAVAIDALRTRGATVNVLADGSRVCAHFHNRSISKEDIEGLTKIGRAYSLSVTLRGKRPSAKSSQFSVTTSAAVAARGGNRTQSRFLPADTDARRLSHVPLSSSASKSER